MSIADKLVYLAETKRQLRQAINAAFDAGLTEDSSFRSYVDALPYTPAVLFMQGEQGAWYDPSDLPTLFQDAAGTTPVTADGDPVGLMLDKSRGLELGPNLADTFDLSAFPLQARVQNVSADSFEVADGEIEGGVAGRLGVSGNRYTAVVHYTRLTPGDIALTVGSVSTAAEQVRETMATSGTITATRSADTANTLYIRLYGAGASVRIDAIELRELKGNHASQAVAASRPIYRTDGTLHWLEFDGIDDSLLGMAYRFDGQTAHSVILSYSTDDTKFIVLGRASDTGSYAYNATVGGALAASYQVGDFRFDGANQAITSGSELSAAMVSGQVASFVNGTPGLRWGASERHRLLSYGAAGYEFSGKLFGWIERVGGLGVEDVSASEAYLAIKAGVTL